MTVGFIVAALLVAALAFFCKLKFFKKTEGISAEVWEATAFLAALPGGTVAGQEEHIERRMGKLNAVAPLWRDFARDNGLFLDGDNINKSDVGARQYFSYAHFTQNFAMGFWRNYGYAFIIVCIVVAFSCLLARVIEINTIMYGEVDVLRENLADFTGDMQAALVVVLLGVISAMFYAYIYGERQKILAKDIAEFADVIDRLFGKNTVAKESGVASLARLDGVFGGIDINADDIAESVSVSLSERIEAQAELGWGKLARRLDELNEREAALFALVQENCTAKSAPEEIITERALGESMMSFMQNMQKVLAEEVTATEKTAKEVSAKLLGNALSIGDVLTKHAETELQRRQETAVSVQKMLNAAALTFDARLKDNTTAVIGLQNQILDDAQINMQKMLENFAKTIKTGVDYLVDSRDRQVAETETLTAVMQNLTATLKTSINEACVSAQKILTEDFAAAINSSCHDAVADMTQDMTDALNTAAVAALNTASAAFSEAAVSAVQTSTAKLSEVLHAATVTIEENRAAEDLAAQNTLMELESASSAIKHMTAEIKQMSADITASADPVVGAAQNLTKATTAFTDQVNKSQRATKKIHKEISDRLKQLVALVGDEKEEKNVGASGKGKRN